MAGASVAIVIGNGQAGMQIAPPKVVIDESA
jgi:hypothetical protein